MKRRTPKLRIVFVRDYYAPGGTVPICNEGDIISFPVAIARGLMQLGAARRLNAEEMKEFHHARAVKAGRAWARKTDKAKKREIAMAGVAARKSASQAGHPSENLSKHPTGQAEADKAGPPGRDFRAVEASDGEENEGKDQKD